MQNIAKSTYLDTFENMGTHSNEQGERFHQIIMDFQHPYQGQQRKYNPRLHLKFSESYKHKRVHFKLFSTIF